MTDNPASRGATATRPHPDSPATGPGPGDVLVRVGAIVFLLGAVATLATMTPLFTGAHPLPSVFYWLCMLMGVGFLVAAGGVLRSVSAQRREARAGTEA